MHDNKTSYQYQKGSIPVTSCHTKNVTELAWWWWVCAQNYDDLRQLHRVTVVMGVDVDYVPVEALYLGWFLWDLLISDLSHFKIKTAKYKLYINGVLLWWNENYELKIRLYC